MILSIDYIFDEMAKDKLSVEFEFEEFFVEDFKGNEGMIYSLAKQSLKEFLGENHKPFTIIKTNVI